MDGNALDAEANVLIVSGGLYVNLGFSKPSGRGLFVGRSISSICCDARYDEFESSCKCRMRTYESLPTPTESDEAFDQPLPSDFVRLPLNCYYTHQYYDSDPIYADERPPGSYLMNFRRHQNVHLTRYSNLRKNSHYASICSTRACVLRTSESSCTILKYGK